MTTTTIDHIDESVGRLLAAIEHALAECNTGDAFAASITLAMALEEHKARLAQLSKPTGASDKRWMGNQYDGKTFIDPAYLRRLRLASRYIRRYAPLARLWESEKD